MRRGTTALAKRLLTAIDRGELSAPRQLVRLLETMRDVATPISKHARRS
jgi:hypothetical protein